MRAKAESEVIRANKMIDYLHEMLEKKKAVAVNETTAPEASRVRPIPRCLDQDRAGGCPFRDTCRYVHDEGRDDIRIVKTEDCGFWLEGSCRFTDRACRNIHDTNKRGTKPKQEPRRSFGGSTNGSFLGHGNPAGHTSQGQKSAGQGLQLVSAGDQQQ